MAHLKVIENQYDVIGAQVGGLGGMTHAVNIDMNQVQNVDPGCYTANDGQTIWDTSRAMVNRVNEYISDNITHSTITNQFHSGVRRLTTGEAILQTSGLMQHYVMTHPDMMRGYIEGSDYFSDYTPECKTADSKNVYYRRLHEGLMTEEDSELVTQHFIDDDLSVEDLTFKEQRSILLTHAKIDELNLSELYEDYLEYE